MHRTKKLPPINRRHALILLGTIGLLALGIVLWNLSLSTEASAQAMTRQANVMNRQSASAVHQKKRIIKKAPDTFRTAAKKAALLARTETRLVQFQFNGNRNDSDQVRQNYKDKTVFASLVAPDSGNTSWDPRTMPWYTNADWKTVYLKSMATGKDVVPCAFAFENKKGHLMGLATADYTIASGSFTNIHIYMTASGQADQPQLVE